VKQNASIVAGEGTAGAIGALQARCKAYDQQTRIEGTERGDRRVEPGRFFGAPRFTKRCKARAARAVAPRLAVGASHGVIPKSGYRFRDKITRQAKTLHRYSKDSSSSSAPTGAPARCGAVGGLCRN